tara:strand:+ start:4913 stop:6031 length:1119 start_codon:yes stop_codon:yes gene_type:complete
MTQNDTASIKKAVGVRSVFLAARRDKNLVGRFFHMEGQFLLENDGRHATKRALADVMVYMAGTYGKSLTLEEVELGLLAAAKDISFDNEIANEVIEPQSEVEPTSFLDDEPEEEAVVTMESNDTENDFFTEDFASEAPPKPQRRGRPGVKPNDVMINAMLNSGDCLTPDNIGISTFDVALKYYNFIENELAVPESEDQLNHKVKLAIGSTMKALGWKKRMRSGKWGWHPTDDFSFGDSNAPLIDPDDVVLRKRDQLVIDESVEEEDDTVEVAGIADTLPRLSNYKKEDVEEEDDLPWPDTTEDFTDGFEPEPASRVEFVKIVDVDSGIEDVQEMNIFTDKTMTFIMEEGNKRMLEWDSEEGIWTYNVGKEAI